MEFVSICQTSPPGMSEIMSNRFTLEIPSPTPVNIVLIRSELTTPLKITRINVKRKLALLKLNLNVEINFKQNCVLTNVS